MSESESENENILEVHNLNVYYGKGRKKHQVLKNVDFTMRSGEILGLVGESGCGKTTLSKTILGLLKDKEGSIQLNAEHPQMIFQDPFSSLNPSKTIGWILEEPLRILTKLNKTERVQRVKEMLVQVGLDESYYNRKPSALSGGQRQRISIGAALLAGSHFVIADEPVSALDVTIQAQVMELLKKMHKEYHLSMLFISHDLKVVANMCENVLVMKSGQIVEKGRTEDIFKNPQHEYTKQLLEAFL